MGMRFEYPVEISRDEAGRYLATFPDVPEAGDDGATEAEAIEGARGALLAALAGYVDARRPIPIPSRPARGQHRIVLDPLVAAKVALYQAMRERALTNVALAERLGDSEAAVRRLLDLEHNSRIGAVAAALAVLDKRIIVEVEDAA